MDTKNDEYQIIVTNIRYNELHSDPRRFRDRPDVISLDLPEAIRKISDDKEKFYDSVESFAYNMLTRKYGAEVTHCQVWLPL